MRFTAITTAVLATSALAAPTPASGNTKVAPNTATCQLSYGFYHGTWTVNIGRPYLNGKGCKFVKDAIHKQMPMMSYKCEDNGHGQTMLKWKTDVEMKKVNDGLQAAYPMIPFVKNNVCDPYLPL